MTVIDEYEESGMGYFNMIFVEFLEAIAWLSWKETSTDPLTKQIYLFLVGIMKDMQIKFVEPSS